jgi:hypothetical protein
MLGFRCWSKFNGICKNTGVFWECWQDLTTNPNGAPLSETFGNVDTPV